MVMIDLNPNVEYKNRQKQVLQKMCRELYQYVPALQIEKGNTLAADVMGFDSEISFAQYKRDKNGNFVRVPSSGERSIFVEMSNDKSGKLTGDYLHSREIQRKQSVQRTASRGIGGNNISRNDFFGRGGQNES